MSSEDSLSRALVLTIYERNNEEVLEQKFVREIFEEVVEHIQQQHSFSVEDLSSKSFISILRLRDLRRLDPNTGSNDQITLAIRQHAVLFSMVKK